ncbi:MAG: small subunit ribosomal protein S1 [Planctomycetota bacterium]|jgi:small subunit ribosomal protein S1
MSSEDKPEDSIDSQMEASLEDFGKRTSKPQDSEGEERGKKFVQGTIAGVAGYDIFVELGPRQQGVIKASEFDTLPGVGETFEFSVIGEDDDLILLSRGAAREQSSWQQMDVGDLVKAKVVGQNTGGLELKVGPLAAFMPASHVALQHVEDLAQFIGQTFNAEVLELDPGKKRILLSRRAVLKRQVEADAADARSGIGEGQIVTGKITKVEDFGAFVEISPGVEGLLHVSNISRKRVNNASEVLNVGEDVQVKILEITEGGRRIGLGMKQLLPDPWDEITERFPAESMIKGKVTRNATFGAFVEIMDGIEGLVHISQLGLERGRPVSDVAKIGQELTVRVQSIDRERERISLSLLDRRGSMIGSTDEAEDELLDEIVRKDDDDRSGGTNLGDLLRRALD